MRRWWWRRRWSRLREAAREGPVKEYLNTPSSDLNLNVDDTSLLALDLETTGLDPKQDSIIALGWVQIERGRILLETATSKVVSVERPLPARSVVIHGLGDDQVAHGGSLRDALAELLPLLAGRVLVAHHAALDVSFIVEACRRTWQSEIALPCIDTLTLLQGLARRRQRTLPADALTLARARARFNLPNYPAHDALWDAIGAAELWLALRSELAPGARLDLGRVVKLLP